MNHILTKFKVKCHLAEIGKKTDKGTKGKSKAPPKALTRIPQKQAITSKAKGKAKVPPLAKDSSDEDSSE